MPFEESGPVETAVTTTIFVRAPRNSSFDVCTLVARIRAEYPNAAVVAEDSFEAERARYRQAIAADQVNGTIAQAASLIEDSINRKEAATGPGMDLCIPVDDGHQLSGYIRAQSIRFHTGSDASQPTIARFVRLLETLTAEPVRIVARS